MPDAVLVYVDELREYPLTAIQPSARRHGRVWCHLMADDIERLHAFAVRLGMRREWFQSHHNLDWMAHYDLLPSKRALAVRWGAIEIEARTWIRQHLTP